MQTFDYANYLYNSTNIRTDDVPIFTDDYAPVEAFLSPLTNAQFNITDDGEWEETTTTNTNTSTNIDSDQQTRAIATATLVIAGVWVFHARRTCKKS